MLERGTFARNRTIRRPAGVEGDLAEISGQAGAQPLGQSAFEYQFRGRQHHAVPTSAGAGRRLAHYLQGSSRAAESVDPSGEPQISSRAPPWRSVPFGFGTPSRLGADGSKELSLLTQVRMKNPGLRP